MARRVDFLVCGTQKGGTTALHNYLGQHKELYLPKQKELHYFDDESLDWRKPNHDNYHDYFCDESSIGKTWGEVTPIYMYWNNSMERIWQYNKKIKIIIKLTKPSINVLKTAKKLGGGVFKKALSLVKRKKKKTQKGGAPAPAPAPASNPASTPAKNNPRKKRK
jgi:hypothetical protein